MVRHKFGRFGDSQQENHHCSARRTSLIPYTDSSDVRWFLVRGKGTLSRADRPSVNNPTLRTVHARCRRIGWTAVKTIGSIPRGRSKTHCLRGRIGEVFSSPTLPTASRRQQNVNILCGCSSRATAALRRQSGSGSSSLPKHVRGARSRWRFTTILIPSPMASPNRSGESRRVNNCFPGTQRSRRRGD